MKNILILVCLASLYVTFTFAIKCYECQDVPPVKMDCSRMGSSGVVLNECTSDWDACQTIMQKVYNQKILLRACGTDDCKYIMNITGLPGEVFLSCETCFEDGCNNVLM